MEEVKKLDYLKNNIFQMNIDNRILNKMNSLDIESDIKLLNNDYTSSDIKTLKFNIDTLKPSTNLNTYKQKQDIDYNSYNTNNKKEYSQGDYREKGEYIDINKLNEINSNYHYNQTRERSEYGKILFSNENFKGNKKYYIIKEKVESRNGYRRYKEKLFDNETKIETSLVKKDNNNIVNERIRRVKELIKYNCNVESMIEINKLIEFINKYNLKPNSDILYLQGEVLRLNNNPIKAREVLTSCLEYKNYSSEVYLSLGLIFLGEGSIDEAENLFFKYVSINYNTPIGYYQYAMALYFNKKYSYALYSINTGIEILKSHKYICLIHKSCKININCKDCQSYYSDFVKFTELKEMIVEYI